MIKKLLLAFLLTMPLAVLAQSLPARRAYAEKYKDWAIIEMNRTGIPASITLAQGILESDCGNSMLAVDANNHFGIKCHSDWTGETAYKDDDQANECFRKYESAYLSFVDHSDFLVSKSRYSNLFKLERTDYVGWARGLKNAGYATAADYADRLIRIIEEENLSQYDVPEQERVVIAPNTTEQNTKKTDSETQTRKTPTIKRDFGINPFPPHNVRYNNGVRYIELNSNDTFVGISSEFHLMVWELLKYNDLKDDADISALKYLYMRPKRNRSHPDCPTHTVEAGDTMWSISHRYGVKLRKLLHRNGMTEGQEPAVGTVIRLR